MALSYCSKIIGAEYITKQNLRLNLVVNDHSYSAQCRVTEKDGVYTDDCLDVSHIQRVGSIGTGDAMG